MLTFSPPDLPAQLTRLPRGALGPIAKAWELCWWDGVRTGFFGGALAGLVAGMLVAGLIILAARRRSE